MAGTHGRRSSRRRGRLLPPSKDSELTFPRVLAVVADTLNTVHSTLSNNSYSAPIYERAEGVAQYVYEQSKPLQDKFAGPIGQADALANKGLDFVQSKAPYVCESSRPDPGSLKENRPLIPWRRRCWVAVEAKTDDIVAKARQPADQAYAYGKTYTDAASARLAPITEQFQTRLSQSQASLHALQEKLQQAVQGLPRDPKGVQDQLKTLTEQVVAEVEKVTSFVGEKRKELPQQAQSVVAPLVEKLQQSYSDIKAELAKSDVPLSQRANNVLSYSREQATPLVHDFIEAIKNIVGKAEKRAGEVTEDAKAAADKGAAKVNGVVSSASS